MQLKNESRRTVSPSTILAYVILCIIVFVIVYRVACHALYGDPIIPEPAPTSTPEVTTAPTPVPEDLSVLVDYFVTASLPSGMVATNVLCLKYNESTNNITVILQMDVMSDGNAYLRASAKFIHGFLHSLSTLDGIHNVTINITGPFVDVYGNDKISTGVRVEYSMATIRKINYSYFDRKLRADPISFIRTADDYYIHPSYQD